MTDCANIEVRESLPELLHGQLDAALRARVEAHVAACADCAAELAMLRATRRAFAGPSVDVGRIAAAVGRQTVQRRPTRARSSWGRFGGWRIAASLALMALGGAASIVIARRGAGDRSHGRRDVRAPEVATAAPTVPSAGSASVPRGESAMRSDARTLARGAAPSGERARATRHDDRPSMAFAGLAELSDAELESLLGSVDRLDGKPAAEPERIAAPGSSEDER